MHPTEMLLSKDQQYCWHPFTQAATASPPLAIVRGEGSYLFAADGQRYFDAASSWWVNLHGHCHPAIAKAIASQANTLAHTLFAGITHPPAVMLAEQLAIKSPANLQHVFFTDNGSTAIEVALKMACQYWVNQGQRRTRLLALRGGYHGDTFGAMAAGRSSGFYTPFEPWLFKTDFLPYPDTWLGEPTGHITAKEEASLHCLRQYLERFADDTVALLVEPLVQGAAGMRMARPGFVKAITEQCQRLGIPVVFDEVMTGFGRTGTLFAAEQCASPDILCLSKGLTGGFMPMGATLATSSIYNAFLSSDVSKALLHGHSYTANPLGCAAALASLCLFDDSYVWSSIRAIEAHHALALLELSHHPAVERVRQCGTIAAFDVKSSNSAYGSSTSQWLRQALLKRHVLARPLGNTLYFIPPYCTSTEELASAYLKVREVLDEWLTVSKTAGTIGQATQFF